MKKEILRFICMWLDWACVLTHWHWMEYAQIVLFKDYCVLCEIAIKLDEKYNLGRWK